MAHPRMVDAYVRELLGEAFGDEVRVDRHAYILPLEARPVVEVVPAGGNALRVQVAAPVADGVAGVPELFEALNEVNARLPYGRVFLAGDRVWAEDTVLGESVDRPLLDNAIHFVSWVVTAHGPALAEAGGGQPTLTDARTDEEAAANGATPAPGRANTAAEVGDPGPCLPGTATGDAVLADTPVGLNAAGYL
jgi:hypothetical protein